MSTIETTLPSSNAGAPAPAARTWPFLWSVRRELWENRSLYIAPGVLAALFLFGNVMSLFALRHRAAEVDAMAPAQHQLVCLLEHLVGGRWVTVQRKRILVRRGRYATQVRPRKAGLYRVSIIATGVTRHRTLRARHR